MTERKRNLRPVRDVAPPTLQFRTVHGYRRAFRIAGSGPAILLIHGIGDNSTTWNGVHAKLAQRFTVIAPDLLGHGQSDKPRADYSVAAYANGMRDLLSVLDIERVTIVGHSLGGGVAMQFAYQFPQLVDRLILVSAGGVTKDVNIVFRLASLPMGSEAMALLRLPLVLPAVQIAGRIVGKAIGTTSLGHDLPNVLRILDDLPEPTASAAFGRTLRAVVDWRGQMVTMLDRCYLTEAIPVQIIWGTKDVVLPVRHAHMAHAAMPGSQLEIFEGSGHFPFHDDPARFIDIVERFMDTTEPAEYDQAALRALLRRGGGEATVTGSADTRVAVLNAIGSNERSATLSPPGLLGLFPRSYSRAMAIEVSVLRVFTDSDGNFGNPLGVINASKVEHRDRQQLAAQSGYSETIFVDLPSPGSTTAHATIHTPRTEIPFAGHPTVGASWWLRERGTPINTLQVPAGIVQVSYHGDLTAISARSEWAPEFAIHDLDSLDALAAADPADFPDDIAHYLWTWTDRSAGSLRARMFAANLGVTEDEATGAAAIRITDYLSRDLTITQGKGSLIHTTWSPEGWVRVAGRVVSDGVAQLD